MPPRNPGLIAIVVFLSASFLTVTCVGLIAPGVHWFFLGGREAWLEDKRDYLLHQADHERILAESREILANPRRYPHARGSALPEHLPPYLASLEASSLSTHGNGVLITFQRESGLYAVEQNTSQVPGVVHDYHNIIELRPGLWYFELHDP